MSDIESQRSESHHRRSLSPTQSSRSSHHNHSEAESSKKDNNAEEELIISYGRRFRSRSSSSSSESSISLRLPVSDETTTSPPVRKSAKSASSSSSDSNPLYRHHHRHHHLQDYFYEHSNKNKSSSSHPLKSKSPPSVLTVTPDSAIIPSVRCAFCLPCCLLLCFLLVIAVVLIVLFLLNLFQLTSSSIFSLPSRWSGQLTFAGTYVFNDAFKSNWSPETPVSLRRPDSLPYELAKAEGERVVIKKTDAHNHSYSLTASNPLIKSSQSTPEMMLNFTEGVPVEVTRVVDEFQSITARFRVTVSITGADWVETYEPVERRQKWVKMEIRREFSREGMTVSYVVGKAVYVKRFEKL